MNDADNIVPDGVMTLASPAETAKQERKELRELSKQVSLQNELGNAPLDDRREKLEPLRKDMAELRALLRERPIDNSEARETLTLLRRRCKQALNHNVRDSTRQKNTRLVDEQIREVGHTWSKTRVYLREASLQLDRRASPRQLPSTPSEVLPLVEKALEFLPSRGRSPVETHPLTILVVARYLDVPPSCLTQSDIKHVLILAGEDAGNAHKYAQRMMKLLA